MAMKTQPQRKALLMWAVGAILFLAVLMSVSGRWLQSNVVSTESSPITLSTDRNNYTAYRGGMIPVVIRTDGVSEANPLLGLKLTLSGVPEYITLGSNAAQAASNANVARVIVNKVGDKYIIVAYDMRVTVPGELLRLNFSIGSGELPPQSSKVKVHNDGGSDTLLVSEIATKTATGKYLSHTVESGDFFTIVPTNVTAPPSSPTPIPSMNANNSGSSPTPTGSHTSTPSSPPSSSITLATDRNNYTAYRGGIMPVVIRVDGVSETMPLLGLKLTLSGVPDYVTLPSNGVQAISDANIARVIVNKVGDKYVVVVYDMSITAPGELIRLHFAVGSGELPSRSSKVKIYNDPQSETLLVSEISTKTTAGRYLWSTIPSGDFFTIVSTNVTAPPSSSTPVPSSTSNGNRNGSNPTPSSPSSPIVSPTPTVTYVPIVTGKAVPEGEPYVLAGAGSNRFLVNNVRAIGTDYSSVIAVQWSPVPTVKQVFYHVYRANHKACPSGTTDCYQPSDFRKVAITSDISYAVDATAQPGQQYVYAVENVVDAKRSLLSNPSAPVIAGSDLGAFREPGKVCVPYSSSDGIRLSQGAWISSDPSILTVGSGSVLKATKTATAKGGIAFATTTVNNQLQVTFVFVAPRGDTDCNNNTNALDQNNVATGWTR